jgi:hypothetical protein
LSLQIDNNESLDASDKNADPYHNNALIYYLEYGRHKDGISRNTAKRVEKLSKQYLLEDDRLKYRKDEESVEFLVVPKIEERRGLVVAFPDDHCL